ncbi:mediator complex, subunit Med8 [Tricladium varicosporioides]|nr:mediator complex, subunit Med8 [Hymenoscyphus varicosporioides]
MAQAGLSQEDLKALEQTRQRLYQLRNNILSLKASMLQSNPLPPWPSIQNSASILATSMQTLTGHLETHSDAFNKIVVHPSTNYPGREHENVLGQLLRKKPEPAIETAVEAARIVGLASKDDHEEELWNWSRDWVEERLRTFAATEAPDDFTAEERERGLENVNTGLRRKLDERRPGVDDDESEDESDEDEEMENNAMEVTSVGSTGSGQVQFGLGPVRKDPNAKARTEDEILRFATSGTILEPGVGTRR